MRKLFIICMLVVTNQLAFSQSPIPQGPLPEFAKLDGKQFIDGAGNPFYPMLVNWGAWIIKDVTSNTFYLSSYPHNGASADFECGTNLPSCETQILNEFNYIASMGFNGIRVNSLYPRYDGVTGNLYFLASTFSGTTPGTTQGPDIKAEMLAPFNDVNSTALLDIYQKLLDIASNVSTVNGKPFYVIINTWGTENKGENSSGQTVIFDWETVFQPLYTAWLTKLGDRLKLEKNLLAYDFFNEPCYAILETGFSKKFGCDIMNQWVDAIRTHDRNHLTTVGDCWDEAMKFDPAAVKFDFVSPHVYPAIRWFGQSPTPIMGDYISQLQGSLYWMNKNMPLPWIVGETGFTAIDPFNFNDGLDGTENAQRDFASFAAIGTRNCMGSGFSWWNYQDGNATPGTAGQASNFFGLLKRPPLNSCPPLAPCSTMNKSIVNFFMGYSNPTVPIPVPSNCVPPANYADPFNHLTYNTNASNDVTGIVTDKDGNPIEDAIVYAWTWLETVFDPVQLTYSYNHHPHYTFTNGLNSSNPGGFTLRPYNYIDPSNNYLVHVWATGIGMENHDEGNWEDFPLLSNTFSPQLKRINFGYNGVANNIIVSSAESHNLRGYQSLTVSNSIIENGGSSNITSREVVNVNTQFHAEYGSAVHLFNADFDECPSYDGLRLINNNASSESINNSVTLNKEIALTFLHQTDAVVYPNPNQGNFTVNIIGFKDYVNLKLQDIQGRKIQDMETTEKSITFNNNLSKGIYFLSISDNQNLITKKITIN